MSSVPAVVVQALDPGVMSMVVTLVRCKLKHRKMAAVAMLAGSILDGPGISTLMSAIFFAGRLQAVG